MDAVGVGYLPPICGSETVFNPDTFCHLCTVIVAQVNTAFVSQKCWKTPVPGLW